jgi:hypothetical protein
MKYLVINGGKRTGKDVLANCLSLRDGFVYVEPFTTNEEHSRIWNTPYIHADRMRVLMGESAPIVSAYVGEDIYVYFEDMMTEDAWNILILNDEYLQQLQENCKGDTIVTVHIKKPCTCSDEVCECDNDGYDVVIDYSAFISDNAQAIEEFLKNV